MKIGIRLWLVFWLEAQKIFLPGSSDSLVRFFFCFPRRQIRIAQRPLHARLIPPGMASGSCWWAAGNRSHLFPHFLFFLFFLMTLISISCASESFAFIVSNGLRTARYFLALIDNRSAFNLISDGSAERRWRKKSGRLPSSGNVRE